SVLIRYNDSTLQLGAANDDCAADLGAIETMVDDWKTDDAGALFDAILRLDRRESAERFFRDLCTLTEIRDMAQRWAVVRLLAESMHYAQLSRQTGASTATITRIASWLNHGQGG